MTGERGQGQTSRDDRVAVGDPANGRTVRVVDRIQQQREATQRGRARFDAPVHVSQREQQRPKPEQRMRMHERSGARPEPKIQHVRERGQRPKERVQMARLSPPRQERACVDELMIAPRVARREREQSERIARHARDAIAHARFERQPVIVHQHARQKARRRQQQRQQHDAQWGAGPSEPTLSQEIRHCGATSRSRLGVTQESRHVFVWASCAALLAPPICAG